MMPKLIAAFLLIAGASPAPAENWVVVSISGDGSAAVLIDTDAIVSAPGGIRKMRQLIVLKTQTQSMDAILSDTQINCGASTIRIGRTSTYDVNGKLLGVEEDTGDIPWDPIQPNSNYAAVKQMVCEEVEMPSSSFGAGLPIAEMRRSLIERGP